MLIKNLFRILPELKSVILKAACFTLVLEILKLIPPYLMKVAIDLLLVTDPVLSIIFLTIFGVFVASFVAVLIEDRFILFTAMSTFGLETGILRKAQDKLLSLGLRYHESNPSGDVLQLMNKGSGRLAELTWFVQDQFLGAIFQILLTSCILLFLHIWCGLVFVFFMPIVIYLVVKTGKKVQPYRQKYHGVFRKASWEMNQSLINVRTVKDYVQEAKESRKYNNLLDEYLRLAKIRISIENKDIIIRDLVLGFARFIVLFYAVYLVYSGEMTAGTLVLFATLSEKVVSSLYRLGRLYSLLGDSVESISQFADLFKQVPDIVENKNAKPCQSLSGEIKIQNASFGYESERPIIKNIDLTIPSKKMIALIGRSGSGKTTLIKLLGRHYDLTEGVILADGVDIKNYKLEDYRRKIAVVSQDIEVFDTSVSANIAYGTDSDQSLIEKAAKAAHAHEFIIELPDGYKTRIGERGIKLSGGQRQRLGIARALIMNPAILVFDEATSSLDTESEREIQSALEKLTKEHTMIIIAHRLSTIEKADLVIVLEDGKVMEIGTHKELLESGGLFARMKQLQAEGEVRA